MVFGIERLGFHREASHSVQAEGQTSQYTPDADELFVREAANWLLHGRVSSEEHVIVEGAALLPKTFDEQGNPTEPFVYPELRELAEDA